LGLPPPLYGALHPSPGLFSRVGRMGLRLQSKLPARRRRSFRRPWVMVWLHTWGSQPHSSSTVIFSRLQYRCSLLPSSIPERISWSSRSRTLLLARSSGASSRNTSYATISPSSCHWNYSICRGMPKYSGRSLPCNDRISSLSGSSTSEVSAS